MIDRGKDTPEPTRTHALNRVKLNAKIIPSTIENRGVDNSTARLSTIQQRMSVKQPYKTLPKLKFADSRTSHLKRPSVIFETISAKSRRETVTGHLSFSKQILVLDTLQAGSKHMSELKRLFGIPKQNLTRLVSMGFAKTTWDPSGIGIYYELTKKGELELQRLKAATKSASNDVNNVRNLVHLKRITAV